MSCYVAIALCACMHELFDCVVMSCREKALALAMKAEYEKQVANIREARAAELLNVSVSVILCISSYFLV